MHGNVRRIRMQLASMLPQCMQRQPSCIAVITYLKYSHATSVACLGAVASRNNRSSIDDCCSPAGMQLPLRLVDTPGR